MTSDAIRRFLILASGRSGSTMLQERLNSHPSATCYGELFDPSDENAVRWGGGRQSNESEVRRRDEDPAGFLEYAFASAPPSSEAVGFKLFYHQARTEPWSAIWPHLSSSPVRVLHLVRDNLLRQFTSLELARKTKQWWTDSKNSPNQLITVELQPARFRHFISRQRTARDRALEQFNERDVHEVHYADLIRTPHMQDEQLLGFLSLENAPLSNRSRRQNPRPLAETISNFEEFRAEFRGQPEETWFDD